MLLRPMTIEDYPQAYRLWTETEGMGLNPIDDSEAGIARYLARNPGNSFVAEEEGAVVGVIMAGHDGRRGAIYHTAVRPEHRGQGMGRALVDAALDALRRQGIRKATLMVFRDNQVGNAFWESAGFAERVDLVYRNKSLDG